MKKFYHSFWSKPAIDSSRWDISGQLQANIWLHALSAAYVHKAGCEIHLITDSEGIRLFDCINYDSFSDKLNVLKDNHLRLWAAGKVLAQRFMDLGDVHIDGDVFLKGENLCKNILKIDGYVIIQNGEDTLIGNSYGSESCYHLNINLLLKYFNKKDFPREFDFTATRALNCGLVSFRDAQVKAAYIKGYFNFLKKMNRNAEFCKALTDNKFSCPDLVMEQMYLFCVCKFYGKKIVALLSEFWNEETAKAAQRTGYTHLIGGSKYGQIDAIKKELKEVDTALYGRVKKRLKTLNIN